MVIDKILEMEKLEWKSQSKKREIKQSLANIEYCVVDNDTMILKVCLCYVMMSNS